MKFGSVIFALSVLLLATEASAGGACPVVVELYTSQSCGPCVAADTLLTKLSKRQGVIALTFAVNYWDILGWKDTLASEAATRRQKNYAKVLGKGGVYTPQMIVGGQFDMIGNREDEVNTALNAAAHQPSFFAELDGHKRGQNQTGCPVGITATQSVNGSIQIHVPALLGVTDKNAATVWLLTLRRTASVAVGGGENKGRTLNYSNVVQDIVAAGKWSGSAATFQVSRSGLKASPQDDIVVVLQQNGYGRVLGAAFLDISGYYARRR
jgi:hypothetical protein